MPKWKIKNQDEGRYVRVDMHEENTIIFTPRKENATVFDGSRDYIVGICQGLKMCAGYQFIYEPVVHIQMSKEGA